MFSYFENRNTNKKNHLVLCFMKIKTLFPIWYFNFLIYQKIRGTRGTLIYCANYTKNKYNMLDYISFISYLD